METNLTADLHYFINNCSFYIGDKFLEPLDKIIICRICNEEVLKSRLYEHSTSKEHINTEKYFIRKCMTYCIQCNMEIKNNEWNQHINSNWHLGHGTKNCDVCKSKYISIKRSESGFKRIHQESASHKKRQEGLVFYPN